MVCKCHTVTFCLEICVKMSTFKVDVQSDHLETKCSWVKVSQGKNVTVDVSSGSKCHSGRNVGGRNVKASNMDCSIDMNMQHGHEHPACTYHIRFATFASDHICFASIRFNSYSFRMPNFRIRFESNRSESNPLICYFANIYSLPNLLYSLRSEYEWTPYFEDRPDGT
jgi:hypothetical protein